MTSINKKTLQTIFYLSFLVIGISASFECSNKNDKKDTATLPDEVSYNFDIRPILSDKCSACHGPDANKRKAGLRMDNAESAFAALKENPTAHALVAFKPEQSEAFLRISSKDTALVMPPFSSQ